MAEKEQATKTKTPRTKKRRRPRRAQNNAPASATGDPPVIEPFYFTPRRWEEINALLRRRFRYDGGRARRAALMVEGFMRYFNSLVGESVQDSYWHTIEITGDGAQVIIDDELN